MEDLKIIGMAVIVALILIGILGSSVEDTSTDYNLEVSCESNQDCVSYTMDCIVHDSPGYTWTAEIECNYGSCYCISGE